MNELGIKPEHECFDPATSPTSTRCSTWGSLEEPLQISLRDGRHRRHPADRAQPRAHVRADPRRGRRAHDWGVIGISRDQWMLVGRGADARRQRPRRPGGQLLPARRRDGPLQRRPDRQGAADGRGRRPAARRRWPRRASCSARPRQRCRGMSMPLEGIRVLDLSRLLPGGFCSLLLADFGAEVLKVEDTGMGDYVRWAPPYYEGAEDSARVGAVPLAQPQQALDPRQPQDRAAGARCCCGSRASTTCCSSPSAPACSTASASATSACARRTPASSTARSPATGRTARTATAPATT